MLLINVYFGCNDLKPVFPYFTNVKYQNRFKLLKNKLSRVGSASNGNKANSASKLNLAWLTLSLAINFTGRG
jgi:hypothetical protein